MSYHSLANYSVGVAWSWVVGAAGLTVYAATGYPWRRRPGHSPFAYDEYSALDVLGVLVGGVLLVYWGAKMLARSRTLVELRRTQDAHFFARAGAPRAIYELLLGVAVRDGHLDAAEHAVVQRILTKELPEQVLPQDLTNWAAVIASPRDPMVVARSLTLLLDRDECETLLGWCRKVAAADGAVAPEESELLERLASVLPPPEAGA